MSKHYPILQCLKCGRLIIYDPYEETPDSICESCISIKETIMKYVQVNITIEAETLEDCQRILLENIKAQGGLGDCSMHCCKHDPTIPYLGIFVHNLENDDLQDCSKGC